MPELPEIEHLRVGLEQHLVKARLTNVIVRRSDLRWEIPQKRIEALVGSVCTRVSRRAKYLLFHLNSNPPSVLLIHLGMSGRLTIDALDDFNGLPPWKKHEHWRMQWDARKADGLAPEYLRFVDPRRFGMLDCIEEKLLGQHRLLAHLGVEPLSEDFGKGYLFQKSRRSRSSVKAFIMNAKQIVGVGNIYASEACFAARIQPQRSIGELSFAECEALTETIRSTLRCAIDQGGTTLRDYIGLDAKQGNFQHLLKVYGREGQPCSRCSTTIKRVLLGQRSTFYCPSCQK